MVFTIYTKAEDGEDFIIRDMNRAGEKIDKVDREKLLVKAFTGVPQAKDFGLYETFNRVWETGQPEHFPVAFTKMIEFPAGENYVYKLSSGEIISVFNDVTEQKIAEKKMEYLSTHDYITGLYNRVYFDEKVKQLEESPQYPIGIISIDIDGLKMINDTFGHEIGDNYIIMTANILKKFARKQDILARMSGDEFILILPNSDEKYVEKTIAQIRQAIIEESKEYKLTIPLNMSTGYAMVTNQKAHIQDAIKIADENMYSEKLHHGRSRRSSIIKTLIKMLEARDVITQDHSIRTEQFIVKLGKLIGMDRGEIANLKLLAMFHDIGKVGVPDKILFKICHLNQDEMSVMRRHAEVGHHIALSSPELAHIADWILMHHEWWDGNGYPLGVSGENIPLECRMLAVVDAYDAMIKDRPYRSAMTHEEAVNELKRCAGTQFDPYVVEKFLQVIEEV